MLFCNLEFNEKKYLELCISVPEIVKYYNINIHVHANDNSKRRMHRTITWWNRIIIYLISVHFFFRNPFYSLSIFHSFIHQYHLPDVHDARDLESIFSSLFYEKDPYFHHKKGRYKRQKKMIPSLKKKIKKAFTIVYSTSFIHRGIGLERLANKIN